MKNSFYLVLVIFPIIFYSCKNDTIVENQLSVEEKYILDSISKVQQKVKTDSLKRLNPLLILPPDSTYSGSYVDKYDNGIVKFKGTFRFGKRHGQWMSFYPDGVMWSEMQYDKGLRQGPNIAYTENGKVRYSGFYKNDKVDSIWCYYDSTGTLVQKLLYRKNRLITRMPVK